MVCQQQGMQSKRECYGAYENRQGKCSGCSLALLCIDATIAADGYYDSLAEREEASWAEEEQRLMDVAIRDARIL